jgi:hypothetical protein
LNALIDGVEWRRQINGFECDVYLANEGIAVEVDGFPWHDGHEHRDLHKQRSLAKQGIRLLRVRDARLRVLSTADVVYQKNEPHIVVIKNVASALLRQFNLDPGVADSLVRYVAGGVAINDSGYRRILSELPGPPAEKSVAHLRPDLAVEWHKLRNQPLEPKSFSLGSHKKIWWQCPSGHEWQSTINNRVKGHGCPFCYDARTDSIQRRGSLADRFPDVARSWHPRKNGELRPNQLPASTTQKVWWLCDCGNEFESQVAHRTRGGGCPVCAASRIGNKVVRAAVERSGSLASERPDLLESWCYRLNQDFDPEKISRGSAKRVWWECEAHHTWKAAIKTRAAGHGCPECYEQSGERGQPSFSKAMHTKLHSIVSKVCERVPSGKVRFSSLYDVVRNRLEQFEGESLSKRALGSWLKQQGFISFNSNGRWYTGISLRSPDPKTRTANKRMESNG